MSVNPFPSERRASSSEVVELIPGLRRFARTFCRNQDDADDLVQETLTKALANLDKFEPGSRLRSWLFTIMRNTFYTKYKKTAREAPGLLDCVAGEVATLPSQEWSQRSREVGKAMASLSTAHQQVLVLICVLNTSYVEAAAICDCDIGTVKSRLSRARQALLRALGEEPTFAPDRGRNGQGRSANGKKRTFVVRNRGSGKSAVATSGLR